MEKSDKGFIRQSMIEHPEVLAFGVKLANADNHSNMAPVYHELFSSACEALGIPHMQIRVRRGRETFIFSATPDGVGKGVTSLPVVNYRFFDYSQNSGVPATIDAVCTPLSAVRTGLCLRIQYKLDDCPALDVPENPAKGKGCWTMDTQSYEIHWDKENVGCPYNTVAAAWSRSWFHAEKVGNVLVSGLNKEAVVSVTHEKGRSSSGKRKSPKRYYVEVSTLDLHTFTSCCFGRFMDKIIADKASQQIPLFKSYMAIAHEIGEAKKVIVADTKHAYLDAKTVREAIKRQEQRMRRRQHQVAADADVKLAAGMAAASIRKRRS